MSDQSRRGFLKVAGVGAAAVGAVAAGVATAGAAAAAEGPSVPEEVEGAILVHVHDVRTGTISLLVEGQEVTITDADLAARIATALHRSELDTSA